MCISKEEWAEEMKADAAQEAQDAREEDALYKDYDFAMQRLVIDSEEAEIIQQALEDIQSRLYRYAWNLTNEEILELLCD